MCKITIYFRHISITLNNHIPNAVLANYTKQASDNDIVLSGENASLFIRNELIPTLLNLHEYNLVALIDKELNDCYEYSEGTYDDFDNLLKVRIRNDTINK